MNYFCGLEFEKGTITVLGAERKSDFTQELADYLKGSGTVSFIGDKNLNTDYIINAPDDMNDKKFIVHSEKEISALEDSKHIIGVINIDVMEQKIADAIEGYEHLCEIANIESDELAYPYPISKAILNREKYSLMFIDGVNSASKRFLARELAKLIRNGTGIRLINTDSGSIEILCK